MSNEENEEFASEQSFSENATEESTPPGYGPEAFVRSAPDIPPYLQHAGKEKVRRVGTITMGLALIVGGVCTLLALFLPSFDILTVLKLSPVVLVLLGLEIVINSFLFKGQKLKYDILSAFVCFLLIAGSIGAAAIPMLYRNWGPRRDDMRHSIEQSIETLCAEKLSGVEGVLDADSSVYLNRELLEYVNGADYTALATTDYVRLNLRMAGPYTSNDAFAAACRIALDALQTMPMRINEVYFTYGDSTSDLLDLRVDTPLAWKQDATALSKLVSTEESERRQLERERDEMYSQLEREREALDSELESDREALNSEREALSSERETLYEQLEQERSEMTSQLEEQREQDQKQQESERKALEKERQAMYSQLEQERKSAA